MRHDMLEELFERDAVIVTQISQRRKGDAVPTALDSPDIQIGIKTHVFLRQATLPANGFQSLYNLLHQQVIAPLSFYIANYCNNEIKFYYILVSGGGISDISDAILHCLFPINTKISHLYPHGEPQIHGKTGSTSAQFVPLTAEMYIQGHNPTRPRSRPSFSIRDAYIPEGSTSGSGRTATMLSTTNFVKPRHGSAPKYSR